MIAASRQTRESNVVNLQQQQRKKKFFFTPKRPFLRPMFDRRFDNYINNLPWVREQFQYCLYEKPIPPFPIWTSVGSLVACFSAYFLLEHFISPMFSVYNNLTRIIKGEDGKEIIDESDKEKWNVKIVSALHAIFVFQGAVRALMAYSPSPHEDPHMVYQCGYNTELARFYEAITLGYMFYDFWVCIRAYGFTMSGIFPSLMIHHINILICFAMGLKFHMGFYFTLSFMTNEISQPFLHLSWLLIKAKVPQKHPLSIANGLLLVLTFIGSRFFFNLYFLYQLVILTPSWSPTKSIGIGSYSALVHVGVNAYWCWQMVVQIQSIIAKAKGGKKEAAKKKKL